MTWIRNITSQTGLTAMYGSQKTESSRRQRRCN